jgi:hypothetical protein
MFKFRAISKREYGATNQYYGREYGNTCFFNSFLGEMKRIGFDLSFNEVIFLGLWKSDKPGKMVDTINDEPNLEALAQTLGVRIEIYSEISPNKVNFEYDCTFGTRYETCIRIVKVLGSPHFNGFDFADQAEYDTYRQRQIDADRAFALQLSA